MGGNVTVEATAINNDSYATSATASRVSFRNGPMGDLTVNGAVTAYAEQNAPTERGQHYLCPCERRPLCLE